MNDPNVHCEYHKKRNAVTKCEMCGKVICVECKMVYQQRHTYSYGGFYSGYDIGIHSHRHRYSYYTRHELCPPCYYDRRVRVLKSPQKYCFVFFGLVFTIIASIIISFAIGFVSSWEGPSSMPGPDIFPVVAGLFVFLGIGITVYGVYNILSAPKRISDMEAKKEAFFNKLALTEAKDETLPIKNYCTSCGDEIHEGEKYCDKCGVKH
ncbi:MAG: B-box zinc finger protein [Promethearchaeota archaeon]